MIKKTLALILLSALISCNNANNNTQMVQANTNKQDSLIIISKDTCDQLPVQTHYEEGEEADGDKFRTVDFQEGNETFRVVPDTSTEDFIVHVQRRIRLNCWQNIDKLQSWQMGVSFEDWNDDGYKDIVNPQKWWAEISLYIPETKRFTAAIEVGSSRLKALPNKMRYDFSSKGPRTTESESNLYRFEQYTKKIYAKMKITTNKDDDDWEIEQIELYSVNGEKETFIQELKPIDFPAFWKNNGSENYFERDEFIKDYWTKNWQRFVSK